MKKDLQLTKEHLDTKTYHKNYSAPEKKMNPTQTRTPPPPPPLGQPRTTLNRTRCGPAANPQPRPTPMPPQQTKNTK